MSFGPKKDGSPNVEYFQQPDILAGLETVRLWLLKNFKKYVQAENLTKESLSQLLIQFMQHQESRLGKNASDPGVTRLPVRFFLDCKSGGALCHIFATMFRFKTEKNIKKFDFTISKKNVQKDDQYTTMLEEIETSLIDAKIFIQPNIFIRPDVEKGIADKVREIIVNHDGILVGNEKEATHTIYPVIVPQLEEYARPNFKKDKHVMMHWYYFPESYDSWLVNNFDLPENIPEIQTTPIDRWRVTASWVLHLEEFNEWMSEEDYEVDEQGRKKVHKMRLAVDDLMASGDDKGKSRAGTSKQKRKRSPSPPPRGGKRKSGRSPAVFQKKIKKW